MAMMHTTYSDCPKTCALNIRFLRLQITGLLTFDPIAMITRFPRQQGFQGNKVYHEVLWPQGASLLNIKNMFSYCVVCKNWNILRTFILTGANLAVFSTDNHHMSYVIDLIFG